MRPSILKYSLFVVTLTVFNWLLSDTNLTIEKADQLLNLMIATTSITVAILVTYFFSKIFSEKQERIQRKFLIDDYSKLISSLVKIAFNIRSDHRFWEFSKKTKSVLDAKYPDLTVEEFRSTKWEAYQKYTEELGGEITPQAYMALRGLENNEPSSYEFFRSFKLRNYSLDELCRFKDYCGHIWYFLDERKRDDLFKNSNEIYKNNIKKEYFFIMKKQIEEESFSKDMTNLFSEFSEKILLESYYLTELNQRELPSHFVWISINFLIYLILLIVSIFLFTLDLCSYMKAIYTLVVVSTFISNTIDLAIGLFTSVRAELEIKDFYKV